MFGVQMLMVVQLKKTLHTQGKSPCCSRMNTPMNEVQPVQWMVVHLPSEFKPLYHLLALPSALLPLLLHLQGDILWPSLQSTTPAQNDASSVAGKTQPQPCVEIQGDMGNWGSCVLHTGSGSLQSQSQALTSHIQKLPKTHTPKSCTYTQRPRTSTLRPRLETPRPKTKTKTPSDPKPRWFPKSMCAGASTGTSGLQTGSGYQGASRHSWLLPPRKFYQLKEWGHVQPCWGWDVEASWKFGLGAGKWDILGLADKRH